MRILRRYITTDFVTTSIISLVVLTFVMSIGVVFKVTDLLGRGVGWRPILQVMGNAVPGTLTFSLPVSILTASLLVFGRLSADGEITAMRACGIGVWSVMQTPLLVAALCAGACLYINSEVSPQCNYARRSLRSSLRSVSPLDLLEEGRFIQDFSGMTVYVGKRQGEQLKDVRIYDLRKQGIRREVRARGGTATLSEDGDLLINLSDVRVDPFFDDRPGALFCDQWPIRIKGSSQERVFVKRPKDLMSAALLARISRPDAFYPDLDADDLSQQKMVLWVEINKRLALAMACLAFAVLGMPLGIKAHRKESSIGVAISLLLVMSFYLFIIIADSLKDRPVFRPDLIIWIPVVLSSLLGIALVRRSR